MSALLFLGQKKVEGAYVRRTNVVRTDFIAEGFIIATLWDPSPRPLIMGRLGWCQMSPKAGVDMWGETVVEENRSVQVLCQSRAAQ